MPLQNEILSLAWLCLICRHQRGGSRSPMPQATHFPSKGRNESVSSGPRGPWRANTHRSSMGCWEAGRTPQHPKTPEGSLAAEGTLRPGHCWDGGVGKTGKPHWHRGGRGLGFFFLSERATGPRSPPPCSSHLLSPPALFREPGLLASFPLQLFIGFN